MTFLTEPVRLNGDQFESIVRNLSDPDQPAEWIEIGYDQDGLRVAYEQSDGEYGVASINRHGGIADLSIRL
jgi:hypothetical protein